MRRVVTYTLLAYAFSWSYWGWMLATHRVAAPGSGASHLPGLLGPALAAFVTVALWDGRPGLARLARLCVSIPKAPGFATLAILAAPLAALVVLGFTARPLPGLAAVTAYPGIAAGTPPLVALLAVLLVNGYGEEIGWRGELLPRLLRHMGRIPATLLMAVIWAGWHIPLFAVNASMTALLGPALIGWLIGLTLGAFVLAHLTLATGGSLLAVALWHTGYNFAVATSATEGLTAAVVSTLVMLWGGVILVLWLRHDYSLHLK